MLQDFYSLACELKKKDFFIFDFVNGSSEAVKGNQTKLSQIPYHFLILVGL